MLVKRERLLRFDHLYSSTSGISIPISSFSSFFSSVSVVFSSVVLSEVVSLHELVPLPGPLPNILNIPPPEESPEPLELSEGPLES